MSVHVYLQHGDTRIREFTDPAGGLFDDATGFDALLPAFPILGHVDPADNVELDRAAMPELIIEIDRVLPASHLGPEHRGLERLRTLAGLCARTDNTKLVLTGR